VLLAAVGVRGVGATGGRRYPPPPGWRCNVKYNKGLCAECASAPFSQVVLPPAHRAGDMSIESSPVLISKRLVLINAISGIVTRVLTAGVFVWVIQYLMKRIPEEELALLPVVMSVAMILPLLQTILTGGLSRHVTEAYAKNNLAGVTRIVSSQFPLLLAGGLLILFGGGAAAWNIDHILDVTPSLVGQARLMTLLVIVRLAIGMVLVPFNTGLFANQRFVLQNAIEVAGSLLRMVLMVVLILGIGPQVMWVIVAQVASQLFTQIIETVASVRLLPALRYHPASFDWNTCKRVITFGSWNFVASSADTIRRAADAPILNIFSTPVAVNDFFLGSIVEMQLRDFSIRASQPLLPALTAMHAHQQDRRLAGAFLRGGRIALWASMFLAVPLIVFSYDLFSIYLGSKYAEHVDGATVMVLLLLGFPLTYPTMMLVRIAFARGDIRPVAIRSIAAQLGNLGLTLLLVGKLQWGAVGSASATLAAFVIGYPCLFWPLAVRTLEISWRRFFLESLVPGLLPAVVAGCAGFASAQLISSLIVRVAVGVPICLIVYCAVVILSLKPADRADVVRVRQVLWR
jgi:O-antigen/teichoic acid export membrane protein